MKNIQKYLSALLALAMAAPVLNMHNEDLDGSRLIRYPLVSGEQIKKIN